MIFLVHVLKNYDFRAVVMYNYLSSQAQICGIILLYVF